MIKKAVPSGGDLCIALRQVEACDFPKRGKLGCIIFGSGGLRSRVPLHIKETQFFYGGRTRILMHVTIARSMIPSQYSKDTERGDS